jgi:hypothetical protein
VFSVLKADLRHSQQLSDAPDKPAFLHETMQRICTPELMRKEFRSCGFSC